MDRSRMGSFANQADDCKPNRKECDWAFLFLSIHSMQMDSVI
ncbi:MAG: hypothetical protein ABW139_11940 [Candidatus Thiodiazotropha sp. DIVDIV]